MKYIIFDLDDTLLNNCREVTPYTLQILKQIQAMGHKLVCNTARSTDFTRKYLEQLDLDYAILNGGALILDRQGNVLYRAEVDAETTQAVLQELLRLTDIIFVQTEGTFYSHLGQHTVQKATAIDFSAGEFRIPAQKIVTSVHNAQQAEAIAEKYHLAYTTYGDGTYRRYNHIGATKALGNRRLMELVGGSVADIIAFGDDYGDMDMLREAGVGVLMKNANPRLYGQTSHISSFTNDEDGAARFLADYFGL